jgi:two-component system, OmpR family, sensor histidine kinase KdpD
MDASLHRPDPDAILARLREEETRAKRGHLKVFLGMCPGVGKTYSMLRNGHKERVDGRDVLVGVVETHGRVETQALLDQLTIQPRKEITYHGTVLKEMDLEAIIARRPSLVLVDELAHTNAPGSRHTKRWQDVVELLEAGIDVFTTVNIQHIDSRADAVRQITGANVHETVPDSVFELADEIELIDLTPETLRERLSEGKVYMGERAATAKENFFQEANLTALRELALRFTAERVDRQMRSQRVGDSRRVVWRTNDRLLVAVGPSPFSTQLVRRTRRMSDAAGVPWVAVHVETSRPLAPESQRLLDKNLALARELGAEIVVTHDDNVPAALVRVALEYNATQIVVGKPRGNRWVELIRGGSLVDQLVRMGGDIDIYMVPAEDGNKRKPELNWSFSTSPREYLIAMVAIAAVTGASWLCLSDWFGYRSVGLLYLLATMVLGLRVGRGPVLFAGVLGAVVWNFLFIPPRYTFVIGSFEDMMLYVTTVIAALMVGQLTARIRAQSLNERLREERATALLQLSRALGAAKALDDAVFAALRQVDELFGAQTTLAFVDEQSGALVPHFAGSYPLDDKELGVANWSFRNRRSAGRFTDTLPASVGYYAPLVSEETAVGVLGVKMPAKGTLSLSQRDLLEAFARQLALILEREHLRAASERERILAESEKLHHTLLESVSHELRTPLAVITSVSENLPKAGPALQADLIVELQTAVQRLNRLVGNLLDQTRLESGTLKPLMDWCDAHDLINAAVAGTKDALTGHPLEISVPENLPPVLVDFALTEQALANLLLNAGHHTPPGTPVTVTAGIAPDGRQVFFSVADRGPGWPVSAREGLFKKFARGHDARTGGLGLGLSIVQGFMAAQGGEVTLSDNTAGGARITLYLPHVAVNQPPPE